MTSPRIVVMMGAYNEEQYLDETLPAVLAQTMPDFKMLLVDNGSTDATPDICERYERQDGRIVFVRSPRNLCPGEAMNTGVRLAHDVWRDCRWFLTQGADDVMEPDYLDAILQAADADPEANLIFSPWRWLGHPDKPVKYFPRFNPETCHAEHQIPAWSAIARDLWDAVGEHDEQLLAADWDWVVRARHRLRPCQLLAPGIGLRVREGERKSQSDEVHWPSLHRHLCGLAGKPVPAWAQC
jgi:glycosyltransferase involved in cell wall biosynthesis